jgi:hypothetical protein
VTFAHFCGSQLTDNFSKMGSLSLKSEISVVGVEALSAHKREKHIVRE